MGWAITADSALAVLTTAKHRQTPCCEYKGVAQQHIALAVCTRKSSLMEVSGIRSLMEKLSCVRGCRYFAERASTSAGTWCLLCYWPRAYIDFEPQSTNVKGQASCSACAHIWSGGMAVLERVRILRLVDPRGLRHCPLRLVLEREGERDPSRPDCRDGRFGGTQFWNSVY